LLKRRIIPDDKLNGLFARGYVVNTETKLCFISDADENADMIAPGELQPAEEEAFAALLFTGKDLLFHD
jgi:hypothetical protein